jgi:hypothetical protein
VNELRKLKRKAGFVDRRQHEHVEFLLSFVKWLDVFISVIISMCKPLSSKESQMKKKLVAGLVAGIMMLGMAGVTSAEDIVNTGTPVSSTAVWNFEYSSYAYPAYVALGGQFTIDQGYTITNMDGYLQGSTGSLTAVIYDNSFWPPTYTVSKPGFLLFESRVTPGSTTAGWYGASGLNWHLDPGTYWAVLELFYWNGNNFYGSMPNGAPNPLTNEVFRGFSTQWTDANLGIGIRLSGTPDPIPEPEIYAMMLTGLGVLGFMARRRKQKEAAAA